MKQVFGTAQVRPHGHLCVTAAVAGLERTAAEQLPEHARPQDSPVLAHELIQGPLVRPFAPALAIYSNTSIFCRCMCWPFAHAVPEQQELQTDTTGSGKIKIRAPVQKVYLTNITEGCKSHLCLPLCTCSWKGCSNPDPDRNAASFPQMHQSSRPGSQACTSAVTACTARQGSRERPQRHEKATKLK